VTPYDTRAALVPTTTLLFCHCQKPIPEITGYLDDFYGIRAKGDAQWP
jgi:hypothetical protein